MVRIQVDAECPFCGQGHTIGFEFDQIEDQIPTEFGEYTCDHPLDGGGKCSRAVDGPDERCFQHE